MQKEGIFAGISAGAVLKAAQKAAERLDSGNIVALLADGGWKYLSTELWTRTTRRAEETQGTIWW